MHVRVEEPWDEVAAFRWNHPRLRPDHRAGIAAAVGDPASQDRNVSVVDDFSGTDVNPAPVSDDEVDWLPSHRNCNKVLR
jgi:hypothetical protein